MNFILIPYFHLSPFPVLAFPGGERGAPPCPLLCAHCQFCHQNLLPPPLRRRLSLCPTRPKRTTTRKRQPTRNQHRTKSQQILVAERIEVARAAHVSGYRIECRQPGQHSLLFFCDASSCDCAAAAGAAERPLWSGSMA